MLKLDATYERPTAHPTRIAQQASPLGGFEANRLRAESPRHARELLLQQPKRRTNSRFRF